MNLEAVNEILASIWMVWSVLIFRRHRLLGAATAATASASRKTREFPSTTND